MRRLRVISLGVSIGLLLALALGSTASAYSLIQQSGNYGDFGTSINTSDSPTSPGAKCGYSAPNVLGVAHLTWIKVFPWKAIAYDRTGAKDTQPVTFKVTLQRSRNDGATWKNVGSVSQTRTATDTTSAKFASLTVNGNGKAGEIFRAIVTLSWIYNGHADGVIKASMDYYSVKWTVGDPAWVFNSSCWGTAD